MSNISLFCFSFRHVHTDVMTSGFTLGDLKQRGASCAGAWRELNLWLYNLEL